MEQCCLLWPFVMFDFVLHHFSEFIVHNMVHAAEPLAHGELRYAVLPHYAVSVAVGLQDSPQMVAREPALTGFASPDSDLSHFPVIDIVCPSRLPTQRWPWLSVPY